jgi:uncharacterized protein YicC (UPF0701 family)
MRLLAFFGTPWCWFILLLLIAVLLIAAALHDRRIRHESARDDQYESERRHDLVATAPFESLAALRERLSDMRRHLPEDSNDARWLTGYLHDLENVMDDLYWDLHQADESRRERLLERLRDQVARLDHTVGARLEARLSQRTDRDRLRVELERLRRVIEEV